MGIRKILWDFSVVCLSSPDILLPSREEEGADGGHIFSLFDA